MSKRRLIRFPVYVSILRYKKETSEMANNPRTLNREKHEKEAVDELLYWRVVRCVQKAGNAVQSRRLSNGR